MRKVSRVLKVWLWVASLSAVLGLSAQANEGMDRGLELRPLNSSLEWSPADETVATAQTTSGLSFLLLSSIYCAACPQLEEGFMRVGGTLVDLGPLWKIEVADLPEDFRAQYGVRGAPSLLVLRDGAPIDLIPLVPYDQSEWLAHVLYRAGFLQNDTSRYLATFDGVELVPSSAMTYVGHNWGSVDASGLDLRASTFSGCGFVGASFANSDLTNAVFAGADLEQASFEGASLDGVVWLSVTCPDGTQSSASDNSCAGHLESE